MRERFFSALVTVVAVVLLLPAAERPSHPRRGSAPPLGGLGGYLW